ncbi:MAG TPA: cytochrome c [Thermomicrobiales bacterium]|nr:cytochrome c [Thermomicrobiales bacterium]
MRPCRTPRLLLFVLLVAAVVSACGGSDDGDDAAAADTGDQGNVARELFSAKGCAECHGPDAEGTDTAPTSLAGTRMIIQQFQTRVRNGRGSAMPAHTPEQISDDEIRTLYDWLRE